MSIFIGIETATKNCSVALFNNSELLDSIDLEDGYSHAENLAPFVQKILNTNSVKAEEVEAIAVSKGPGSYTGLRIGVAFSKGFCFANNIPLIAINTLEAMASGAIVSQYEVDALYCPMIDARRSEVYTSLFDAYSECLLSTQSLILTTDSFEEYLNQKKIYFFGDGSQKAKEFIKSDNAIFLPSNYISAKHFGSLINSAFSNSSFEDIAYFEPYYLKEFIAGKPKKML